MNTTSNVEYGTGVAEVGSNPMKVMATALPYIDSS
jgi:hypothetical protein